MIQVPNASKANIRAFNQRTKNLETAIGEAINQGKDSCYISRSETNSIDVLQLEQLGYETGAKDTVDDNGNVDSSGYIWVHWKNL